MGKIGIIIVIIFGISSLPISVEAVDPKPEEPAIAPVVIEEETDDKIEQHAPSIKVGSTRKFLNKGPLSAPEEDDWYYY